MKIGIFTTTFNRPTLEDVLDAVKAHAIESVQFDMSSAGLPEMPDEVDEALCDRIREAMASRQIEMATLSGTFNMIHPDTAERDKGFRSLEVLARSCKHLDTSVLTLCTGTRSTESMWRWHPKNDDASAWTEMITSMEKAVQIAETHQVTLAFEPEVNNVVHTAEKARRLLDEIQSSRLKVMIDGANLFHKGELPRMREILDHAFDLLGDDIIMAHAKDLSRDGDAGHEAAGTGLLDYGHYIHLLHEIGFTGSLILHSLDETQVEDSLAYVRGEM